MESVLPGGNDHKEPQETIESNGDSLSKRARMREALVTVSRILDKVEIHEPVVGRESDVSGLKSDLEALHGQIIEELEEPGTSPSATRVGGNAHRN